VAGFPEVRHPIRLVAVVVGVVLAIAVFGSTCSAPDRRTLPPPSPMSSAQVEETTTTVDHSRTVLQPVSGQTTTTLAEFGDATLSGVVTGPTGPVPGAIVRIERLVGDAVQVREVRTAGDGAWVLEGLPGGRMRVRAYAPPSLTMLEPEIFFLTEAQPRELRLTLREHSGILVLSDVTPDAPTVGSTINLALRVVEKVVDDQGVARTRPIPGLPIQVRSTGWVPVSEPVATASDGDAVFTFRCEESGTVTASALLFDGTQDRSFPLEVPSCGPRPTTTTTTTEPDDDGTTTSSAPTTTEDD
jgi:Carboxypeptidase regulatory-like domain